MTPHDWDHAPTAAEARRWQLLAAGRRAVIERGAESFTVDDIVARAGLAKGSFYNYFASRDAYLAELRYALTEDMGEAAHEAAAGPWPGLFARLMRASVRWQLENFELLGLFGADYMANPDRPTRQPLVTIVEQILAAGAEAGVLCPLESAGEGEERPAETAALVLDVLREACSRAVAAAPDETSILAAEQFLERALRFDRRRAEDAVYEPVDE